MTPQNDPGDWPCWSCHEPQPDPARAYLTCGECFHVYRTRLHLLAAYWRTEWDIWRHPQALGLDPVPLWRLLLNRSTWQASRIYSCQCCAHDF